jgi:hypothetical protein
MATQPPKDLPATHHHAGGQHKWRWVRLFTYNSVGTGMKKVRLMTEVGDVAISHLWINPGSAKPPTTDEELKALERRLR